MDSGDKTKALSLTALTSLGPTFVDPSGASAATFLVTGTGFAISSTYHITRGSFKLIKETMASNREKKAAANISNIPSHTRTQEMIENDFRRLAISLEKLTSQQNNGFASHRGHVLACCITFALLLALWFFLKAGS